MSETQCHKTPRDLAQEVVVLDRMIRLLVGITLLMVVISSTSLQADDRSKKEGESTTGGESSPFIVGEWKLVCNSAACDSPMVDTEFRFVNPTKLTVTLEYAFFENNGTFCGCDRDTLNPNQTTVYTASAERTNTPPLMSCQGNSGALKSIVFIDRVLDQIVIGAATQTGFQTHLFGTITTFPDPLGGSGNTSVATSMAEAGMNAVEINKAALVEMEAIHQSCIKFLGN